MIIEQEITESMEKAFDNYMPEIDKELKDSIIKKRVNKEVVKGDTEENEFTYEEAEIMEEMSNLILKDIMSDVMNALSEIEELEDDDDEWEDDDDE